MFKTSKFRHIVGVENKRDHWYPDLRINTTGSSDAAAVACGAKYIAVNWATTAGAVVALLDIGATGKRPQRGDPPLLHAHGAPLSDMAFSPFDATVLATAGDDAAVKLWRLPARAEECYSAGAMQRGCATLQSHKRRVDAVAFHPSCASLLASASTDKSVRVWDMEKLCSAYTIEGCFTEPVWSVAWNYAGGLLACTSKDRKLRVLDPRAASPVALEGAGHAGIKQSRVTWMGRHNALLTTGFDKMNMRQFAIWDARSLEKPLVMRGLGSSTGVSAALYDGDTDLFFISGKGEGVVRVYEGNTAADPWFSELSQVNSDQTSRGICMVPKPCLNLLTNEVDVLLKVANNAVIPIGFYVPRARRVFQPDLYPDTPSRTPALTGAEWLAGETKPPVLMQLRPPEGEGEDPFAEPAAPAAAAPSASPATEDSAASTPSTSPAPAASASPAAAGARAASPASTRSPTPARKATPQIVRYTKFRHIAGKPFMRNTFLEELRINPNCGTLIRANPTFFAVPWQGPGGRVVVLPLGTRGGKVPPEAPFLEHGSDVVDIDCDPFDDALFATAGEDAHIRLWRIPEGGLKASVKSADIDIPAHARRINTINFSPYVSSLMVSTGTDLTVKLWDLNRSESGAALELAGQHNEAVMNVSWNWAGKLLATACRDTHMRIFDPRAGTTPFADTVAHDGAKGFKVVFAGKHEDRLVTVGFSKSSERVCAVWDMRDLDRPLAQKSLDNQAGILTPYYDADTDVLFITGKGDGNVRFIEITSEAPHIHPLVEYQSTTPFADMDMMHKTVCDVRQCELLQIIRLTGSPPSTVERISFTVPRTRMEYFQDDIFPPTRARRPDCTAEEWLSGRECGEHEMVSLRPQDMTPLSDAPPIDRGPAKYHMPTDEERAAGHNLTREEMFSRFYQKMTTVKDEPDPSPDEAAAQRQKEAESGDCAADDEW